LIAPSVNNSTYFCYCTHGCICQLDIKESDDADDADDDDADDDADDDDDDDDDDAIQ